MSAAPVGPIAVRGEAEQDPVPAAPRRKDH
jgi:hypothetical protein